MNMIDLDTQIQTYVKSLPTFNVHPMFSDLLPSQIVKIHVDVDNECFIIRHDPASLPNYFKLDKKMSAYNIQTYGVYTFFYVDDSEESNLVEQVIARVLDSEIARDFKK